MKNELTIGNFNKCLQPDKHYRLSDVAKCFEVHRSTVYYWIDKGYLVTFKTATGRQYVSGHMLKKFYNKYY